MFEALEIPQFLYHSTFRKYQNRILRNGLLPRSESGVRSNWDHEDTEPSYGFVFLSSDLYSAISFSETSEEWSGDEDDIIVFRVKTENLDKSKFLRDPYNKDTRDFVYRGRIPSDNLSIMTSFEEKFVGAEKDIYTGHGSNRADYIEIFKNPDSGEMNSIMEEARGFVTMSGDLYLCHHELFAKWESTVIHDGIESLLLDKGLLKRGEKYIPVQRFMKTNRIYLSESLRDLRRTYIVKAFANSEEKNPHLEFILDNVTSEI